MEDLWNKDVRQANLYQYSERVLFSLAFITEII